MWNKIRIILIVSVSLLSLGFGFNFVFGVEAQVPTSVTPIGELQSQLNQTQKQRDEGFAELERLINLKESAEKSLEEVKKKGDKTLTQISKDQITQIESESRQLTEEIANQSKQINELNRAIEQKIEELKKTPELMGTYDPAMFQTPGRLPGLIEVGPPGGPEYVRRDFISFLKWLFPFMLSVAAFLAVLMIVISGATMVASAGSESAMKDARSRLYNAILGLILAFAAWLIIWTINPDILRGLF